jgi:hypothetical protein
MSIDELRQVFNAEEEIEYHLMGMEHGADLLSGPGWYPCVVDWIYANGNVEITFTDQDGIGVTVLKRNIGIAFRRKVAV